VKAKLTRDLIAKLAPPRSKKDAFVWDTAVIGLGVRAKSTGGKAYVVHYRQGSGRASKSVRITIDSVSSITLDDARKNARAILGRVALGKDVRGERRAKRPDSAPKVEAVIEAYDRDFAERKVSPYHRKNTISVLRRGLKTVLQREIASLSRQELVGLIDGIELAGARQSFRQRLTPLLNFAVNQGTSSHNVMAGWVHPRKSKAMVLIRKGRSMTERELKRIWEATEALSTFNLFVRAMLMTGLRKTETASLDWRWINKKLEAIVVPAERMKSGRPHSVPLSKLLIIVLERIPRLASSTLLFPVRSKKGAWTTMSGYGQMLAKLQTESGTSNWTIYDLRRTYRSMLSDLGFDQDLCERMIAHSRGSLVERYDRSTRWPERVAAAEALAARMIQIVDNSPD
jgi:integrase